MDNSFDELFEEYFPTKKETSPMNEVQEFAQQLEQNYASFLTIEEKIARVSLDATHQEKTAQALFLLKEKFEMDKENAQ